MQTVIDASSTIGGQAGQQFGDVYRKLDEATLVEMMVLDGHLFDADIDEARASARAALRRFADAGLGIRRGETGLLYDPVEVAWFAKQAAQSGQDDYFHAHEVETARRLVSEGPDMATGAGSPRISLRYARIFDVTGFDRGTSRRLRMPVPLAGRYAALDIKPELSEETTSHRLSEGRLEAKVTIGEASHIRVAARIELELAPGAQPPPLTDESDRDLYLREQEGMVVITPQVQALADKLAGNSSDENVLRRFWDHLIETMMFCQVHYDQVPANAPLDWILRTRQYDCQLGSSLLVGLCRARGIPARLVGGNFLYRHSPTNHYWAEIWLENEGWFPVDFIGWVLSRGGRDSEWRDRFYGKLDPRLIAECQPRNFVGPLGLMVPDRWTMLRAPLSDGAAVSLATLEGREVYRDEITFL